MAAAVAPTDGADVVAGTVVGTAGTVCVAAPCTAMNVCCMAGADELCIATTTGTVVTDVGAVLGSCGLCRDGLCGGARLALLVGVAAAGAVAITGAVAALAVSTNAIGAAAGAGVPNSSTTNVVGSPS